MKNLTTVVTRFPVPANMTADEMRAAIDEAAPHFRNVPGLIRKQFLLSQDGKTSGGVYLWNDEATARNFMAEKIAPMIRARFRVEPTIEFFETPVILEN
jgi:putative monooxygenase ydhR